MNTKRLLQIIANNPALQPGHIEGDGVLVAEPPAVTNKPPQLNVNDGATPEQPKLYNCILWNDNTTVPDTVEDVLKVVFGMSSEDAHRLMYTTHQGTKNVIAAFAKDIAETKVEQAMSWIDANGINGMGGPCELRITAEEA